MQAQPDAALPAARAATVQPLDWHQIRAKNRVGLLQRSGLEAGMKFWRFLTARLNSALGKPLVNYKAQAQECAAAGRPVEKDELYTLCCW
jgi:hypothetical protein